MAPTEVIVGIAESEGFVARASIGLGAGDDHHRAVVVCACSRAESSSTCCLFVREGVGGADARGFSDAGIYRVPSGALADGLTLAIRADAVT